MENIKSIIYDEFIRIKEMLGHRPSRLEIFTYIDDEIYMNMKKKSKINILNDYIGYLDEIGELFEDEKSIVNTRAHEFINSIETTYMTKNYKMPLLLAFYNGGKLKTKLTEDDIYFSFKDFYSKGSNGRDMIRHESTKDYKSWGKEQYINLSKENPEHFLLTSSSEFFKQDGDLFCLASDIEDFKDNISFMDHFKDVIDYRTRRYYKERFEKKESEQLDNCIFCDIYNNHKEKIIGENELAFAIYDTFPVNKGHVLVIPKRHFDNFFDASKEEVADIYSLLHECKEIIDKKYNPTGYNVGVNIGYDAGQTIMHLHVHFIPRYKGDVENPRGGIRKLKPQLVHYEG